jgi:ATP-dependent RNA helicase SUPV3L1/SUV3
MQRLMSARSGVYLGPLRLLAWEVADKMNRAGVVCNLVTGQEKEVREGALHTAGTVEMASTDTILDVAVVDEVQMLSSLDRGHAWTRALLGLPAYEIHVCGDPSMVDIVEELCAITGEPVEVREYQRLTPLLVSPPLRNGLRDIQRGDCVVAFSRKDLYRLKRDIEQQLALKVCIIYGSLPPEARRQQAGLFNDPASGYDVLVATDAIGMGLNLNIGRVVFERLSKFDGKVKRPLTPSETLQIAGRAGRFQTGVGASAGTKARSMEEAAASNSGSVTTLNPDEHAFLKWSMVQPLPSIQRVGLAPTYEQLELLHRLRPAETLSNLLTYFAQYAKLDTLYFTVDMESMKEIADVLEHVPFASMRDRWTFCQAPARMDAVYVRQAMEIYAGLYVAGGSVKANAIKLPNLKTPTNDINMMQMETFYQVLDLYVWLGMRFGAAQFTDLETATKVRNTVARIVQQGIQNLAPSDAWMKNRQKSIAQQQSRRAQKERQYKDNNAAAQAIHNQGTQQPQQRQPQPQREHRSNEQGSHRQQQQKQQYQSPAQHAQSSQAGGAPLKKRRHESSSSAPPPLSPQQQSRSDKKASSMTQSQLQQRMMQQSAANNQTTSS